jgi:hypothetical protein
MDDWCLLDEGDFEVIAQDLEAYQARKALKGPKYSCVQDRVTIDTDQLRVESDVNHNSRQENCQS